ncbi:sugar ABC transporter substrate-binding protein [Nocardiopsis gilva YIM 90087]|uniref:Sugar ABC transporter substrate-binding protein n=1 Tax=Nocardiopsis gilva YIM 90087 TaxID=1235441 RepID=A0A223S9Q3_9ACTN|nr:extracellular solute-binding protein [Nocardiopsis gilva]ASU84786.1 sugar ABC transporter substrate-binding protein [Nocardiopsis gilva YIM 90087]
MIRAPIPASATSAAAAVVLCLAATGCSIIGPGRDPDTVTVVYPHYGAFRAADTMMRKVKKKFEAENHGVTVELHPVEAPPEDYQTQVNLMNQSEDEAPDIIFEDSFTINQDVDAGYLAPLDKYWAEWEDAKYYREAADAAVTALDGKRYGVMVGTDTRGLWYNTKLFDRAGIETPWEPETWEDVLDTSRTLRSKLPGEVTPINVYAGTPAGEVASMQGFQMLLSGTGDTLFDEKAQKWVVGSQGFVDALTFLHTIYSEDLAVDPQDMLNANVATLVHEERVPAGEIAINLDGSWITQSWIATAGKPWPEWPETMEFTGMPTQHGQEPGATSMSGGWTLALGAKSANPDLAWDVMKQTLSRENATRFAIEGAQIPVREDVAESEEFRTYKPISEEAADLVDVTHFRPAYSEYPRISLAIQEATEAVMLGDATPTEAARAYDEKVEEIVGSDNTVSGA